MPLSRSAQLLAAWSRNFTAYEQATFCPLSTTAIVPPAFAKVSERSFSRGWPAHVLTLFISGLDDGRFTGNCLKRGTINKFVHK
uniref:Uncharacterized protein n=1 Tax=Romanomermis culicivorax TaxID=13658 RepID=A0A915HPA0_ROMCU